MSMLEPSVKGDVNMNDWETQLKELTRKGPLNRYELRPGLKGLFLYCSTCGQVFSEETRPYLAEINELAQTHEETTHSDIKGEAEKV